MVSGSLRSSCCASSWQSSGAEGSAQYTTADQALLAAVSRLLPPERWSCFAVSPQTLRRWHRALHEGGRRRRHRRPGRPPLAAETRDLIKRLARENPRWGYVRIQGELLKLGISVSGTTIATVLRSSGLGPAPRRIGPSWSEFERASAEHARRQSELRGGRRPRGRCVRAERVAPGWAGPPGGSWRPPLRGGCRRATFSFSSRVERFGAAAAARSPRDPRAVAAAAVASIACSRRTPKSRPALVPQPSVQARRQNHPVPAHGRRQPRIESPREAARIFTPATARNRSTTGPPSTPEPSFFTPQAIRRAVAARGSKRSKVRTHRFPDTRPSRGAGRRPSGRRLGGQQQCRLLALLLLRANGVVPVDRIIEEALRGEPAASATKPRRPTACQV